MLICPSPSIKLRILRAISQRGQLQEGADSLYVTQPAVSLQNPESGEAAGCFPV